MRPFLPYDDTNVGLGGSGFNVAGGDLFSLCKFRLKRYRRNKKIGPHPNRMQDKSVITNDLFPDPL
jgi:hypothetical protein